MITQVFRERAYVEQLMRVMGLAAAPLAASYDPTDDSINTVVGTDLTLYFDQQVSAVGGKYLVIRKSADNSVVEAIAANDTSKVILSGSKAIINPSAALAYSTGYYVQIDAGAFINSGGEAYAGIANTTSWNFTTRSAATVAVTAYTPANGSTGVVQTADLSVSFKECVTPVAGKNIVIKKISGNSVVETIAADDSARVTLSCSKSIGGTGKAIINPANDLLFNTGYFVQIDAGAFIGTSAGAIYPGILDNSTWAFATVADTIAPTVPAGLSATTVGATQANLRWTASTDNAGVTAYKVYRNGFLVATRGDVTDYSDTGLTGRGQLLAPVHAVIGNDSGGGSFGRHTGADGADRFSRCGDQYQRHLSILDCLDRQRGCDGLQGLSRRNPACGLG